MFLLLVPRTKDMQRTTARVSGRHIAREAEKAFEKSKKTNAFFFDFLTLEDGTGRLSRNVGTELPFNVT
jgi:hypothetical protein